MSEKDWRNRCPISAPGRIIDTRLVRNGEIIGVGFGGSYVEALRDISCRDCAWSMRFSLLPAKTARYAAIIKNAGVHTQ
jgi:hypothetical protein